jgi:hypothetical protein
VTEEMADKYKGRKISITFPDQLFERISEAADTEVRSFSQQVVFLCMEAFKTRDEEALPDKNVNKSTLQDDSGS